MAPSRNVVTCEHGGNGVRAGRTRRPGPGRRGTPGPPELQQVRPLAPDKTA